MGVYIIFAVFVFILEKFNKFNLAAVDIYSKILKWDAYELESRCRKFIVNCLDDKTYEKTGITRDH